jgi:hypothetical protein
MGLTVWLKEEIRERGPGEENERSKCTSTEDASGQEKVGTEARRRGEDEGREGEGIRF